MSIIFVFLRNLESTTTLKRHETSNTDVSDCVLGPIGVVARKDCKNKRESIGRRNEDALVRSHGIREGTRT